MNAENHVQARCIRYILSAQSSWREAGAGTGYAINAIGNATK